jgi:hypothetical protein
LVKHAELEALIDEYAYVAMALDVSGRVAQQESSTWQRDFPLPLLGAIAQRKRNHLA